MAKFVIEDTGTIVRNGAAAPPKPPKARPAAQPEERYHGVPVLALRVGDPIPTPRAPERYAVRVTPDLARYLLTFNHARNRHLKERKVHEYAATMAAGLWEWTPEGIVFSRSGVLQNGQNRLMAVTEVGSPIMLLLDFGWHDGVINAMDRGVTKTGSDALVVEGVPSATRVAAVISLWHKYETVAQTDPRRSFNSLVLLGTAGTVDVYQKDPEGWDHSVTWGRRIYEALDKGGSAMVWGAAHRLITESRGREAADAYFQAIHDGSDEPRSATRTIRDWFVRRPAHQTRSRDSREPLENIVRGFNAWRAGKRVSLVAHAGFELSPVR